MKHGGLLTKIPVIAVLLAVGLLVKQSCIYSQEASHLTALVPLGEFIWSPSSAPVAGAKDAKDFASEAFGRSFSVSAPDLPEGTYTIEIDVAETHHHEAGKRLMRITSGDMVLADHYDIYATAGGYAKATTITGKVNHAADAIGGPLTLKFEAQTDQAKFNVIRIFDSQGKLVAQLRASELEGDPDSPVNRIPQVSQPVIYTNPDKPVDERVDDMISRMSLREKAGQLMNDAPAISRLNLPAYNYWNEALHGVAGAGNATVFPQAIGMAATWNTPLIHQIGDAISTESRAKYYDSVRRGNTGRHHGLTLWAPNINIFRDPRWGRGQETYGEDPYLTSRFGVAFITGMQGNNPKYLKVDATAKHFAIHSGPEPGRGSFNVEPTQRDLYETYLPQFQAAVQEAHVGTVMASYNAINGVPASANHWLLTDLLRTKWGFQGHVVSDCGAVGNITSKHHYTTTYADGSAKAIFAGLDLECGSTFKALPDAITKGLVQEKQVDTALHRVLRARFDLGLFDPPARVPFSSITMNEVESPAHLALARQAARESIVLLKNNGILPLDKSKLKKIAVIGANANSDRMLLGNYNGDPSHPINLLKGIQDKAGPNVQVEWKRGAPLAEDPTVTPEQPSASFLHKDPNDLQQAVELAKSADVVIYVGGLNADLESESSRLNIPGFKNGDRTSIELPPVQEELLKALYATGKPIVLVNCSGSAIAMPWEAANLPAIMQAWYPGGEGGAAVADVLFGDANPSGRLPITIYEKTGDLPAFTDYHMTNRTYRYFGGKVLFPFGYGLSYTTFQYGTPKVASQNLSEKGTLNFSLPIKNTGQREGDEVVQVYVRHLNSPVAQPIHSLVAFQRATIGKGASANLNFAIPVQRLHYWSIEKNDYVVDKGAYEIQIGASSSDIRRTLRVTVQ